MSQYQDNFKRQVFKQTLKNHVKIFQNTKICIDDMRSNLGIRNPMREGLANDLINIGVNFNDIYYIDFMARPGSGVNIHHFYDKCVREADIFVVFDGSDDLKEHIKHASQPKIYFPMTDDYYDNFFNLLNFGLNIDVYEIKRDFDESCHNIQEVDRFVQSQIKQEEDDKNELLSILGLK